MFLVFIHRAYLVQYTWYQVTGTRYHTLSIRLLQQFLHANKKKEQEASERSSVFYLKIFLSNGQPKNIEIRRYIKNNYD